MRGGSNVTAGWQRISKSFKALDDDCSNKSAALSFMNL